ncbi:hypothetical protein M9194_16610 [Vibrio sp. S4M6]|uniref:hypothetical protein n=1 Tax=Vibrio sinus TaxID=2946865 RepID=UPI00202A9210|nr:hypothetical protein [Vibrio sinus]MCL9783052.1 hypothetical protein [Vibrio sinus]
MSEEKGEFPGITFSSTDGKFKFESAEWNSTTIGNKDDWVIGFYTSLAGPFTNKLYGGEYVQYYPGFKIDIGGVKKKYEASWLGFSLERFKCSAQDTEVVDNRVSVSQESVHSSAQSVESVVNHLDNVAVRVNKSGVVMRSNNLNLAQDGIRQRSSSMFVARSGLSNVSAEAEVRQRQSSVESGGIRLVGRRLTMYN